MFRLIFNRDILLKIQEAFTPQEGKNDESETNHTGTEAE